MSTQEETALALAEVSHALTSAIAPILPRGVAVLLVVVPLAPQVSTFVASSLPAMTAPDLAQALADVGEAMAAKPPITFTDLVELAAVPPAKDRH